MDSTRDLAGQTQHPLSRRYLVQTRNSLHTIEAPVDEGRDLETDNAAGAFGVPAVVLNLSALINRDLDLPLIASKLTRQGEQLTYAACDFGAA
jgi:hypothetical protein